jgi:hypothetical protein
MAKTPDFLETFLWQMCHSRSLVCFEFFGDGGKNPSSPTILIAPQHHTQEGDTIGDSGSNAVKVCFSFQKEAIVPQPKKD